MRLSVCGLDAVDNAPIEAPQRYSASATQFYMLNDEENMHTECALECTIMCQDSIPPAMTVWEVYLWITANC